MINLDMRFYDYYLYEGKDAYGQPQLTDEIRGSIKMAINTSSQSIQENIKYKDCTYIGLTYADITDQYVFQYGEEKLKVLYVNPKGRLNQIFLKNI